MKSLIRVLAVLIAFSAVSACKLKSTYGLGGCEGPSDWQYSTIGLRALWSSVPQPIIRSYL
jgi:hypothetical protein